MPLLMTCNCGKPLRVRDELAGKKVRCPSCQALLSVPDEEPGSPEPDEEPYPPPRAAGAARARRPRPAGPPPRRQIVLRIIVLVLAILGAGVAGFLGLKAYSNTHDPEQIASIERSRAVLASLDKASPGNTMLNLAREEVDRFDRLRIVCYFLLAGGVLGVAGGVLAFLRLGKIAAPLLILPAIGAAVFAPITAILTSPLLVDGILAFFIRSAPRRAADGAGP